MTVALFVLSVVVVVGLVALAAFRTVSIRNDRRRQEQESRR